MNGLFQAALYATGWTLTQKYRGQEELREDQWRMPQRTCSENECEGRWEMLPNSDSGKMGLEVMFLERCFFETTIVQSHIVIIPSV